MLPNEKHKPARLLIIYISISLLVLIFRTGRIVEVSRSLLLYILAPSPQIVSRLLNETSRVGESISHLISAREENKVLRERLNSLLQEREKIEQIVSENERLKKILEYQKEAPYQLVSARVIGGAPSFLSPVLLIDKGSNHGIKKDVPVVAWQEDVNPQDTGMALVGRITELSRDMSKVLLITDSNSELSAMAQRNREKGVIAGTGNRFLLFKYLPPTADLKVGDLIITSGMGRIFPTGLAIGSIEEVFTGVGGLEKRARVVPRVNMNRLEDVQIILNPKGELLSD